MKIILDINNSLNMFRIIDGTVDFCMTELRKVYEANNFQFSNEDYEYFSINNGCDDFSDYCHTEDYYNECIEATCYNYVCRIFMK